MNVTEHDPDYWAKDEELRLALVAAGEEFDYKVQNAKILLIHKVRHESLCCILIFQDRGFMPILKLVGLQVILDNEKMYSKMESHFEKHGELVFLLKFLMLGYFHTDPDIFTITILQFTFKSSRLKSPQGLKVLDTREEETKSIDFPLITFIKPNILDYFYNGDKFKILLVRLKKSMFKTEEEKNCIFQKLLSNDIETGNKNDKKNKKPKPKIETEEKAIEKETVVEEKSQKEIQKEQLLKVTHITWNFHKKPFFRIPVSGRKTSRGRLENLLRRRRRTQRRKEARPNRLHQSLSLSLWRKRWRRSTPSTS